MGYEALGFEVVVERDGFDVFLDAARDLVLVAPGVEMLQVWRDGGEQVGNFGLVG